jgi:hypothetical protein
MLFFSIIRLSRQWMAGKTIVFYSWSFGRKWVLCPLNSIRVMGIRKVEKISIQLHTQKRSPNYCSHWLQIILIAFEWNLGANEVDDCRQWSWKRLELYYSVKVGGNPAFTQNMLWAVTIRTLIRTLILIRIERNSLKIGSINIIFHNLFCSTFSLGAYTCH